MFISGCCWYAAQPILTMVNILETKRFELNFMLDSIDNKSLSIKYDEIK